MAAKDAMAVRLDPSGSETGSPTGRGHQPPARWVNGKPVDPLVEQRVTEIEGMTLIQIRTAWRDWLKTEPPKLKSADFLRRLLAWKIQERAYGGHSAEVLRKLKRIYDALQNDPDHNPFPAQHLSPGTILTREWRGVRHRVQVMDRGFAWNGKVYDNLSVIARAISGTHWSGPKFFGLRNKTPL